VIHSLIYEKVGDEIGLPILRQAEKIIDYLKPKYYFIENPQTGKMKEYITRPFYDVDYCMYSDWDIESGHVYGQTWKDLNPSCVERIVVI